MADGFVLASDLALQILERTAEVWSQPQGEHAEPFDHAWKRLFGAPPGVPIWLCASSVQGRTVVVRLYARGRVQIYDPWRGSSIRTLGAARDAVGTIADRLAQAAPSVAAAQCDGRTHAAFDEASHHARVGGAVRQSLLTAER